MSEPCSCGAADCPNCHPGCREKVTCVSCNSDVYAYQVDDNDVCEFCIEEGVGVCENCGKAEILVDDRFCLSCWISEKLEVTA